MDQTIVEIIADVIGILIVILASSAKLPQIIRLVRAESSAGVSQRSSFLETMGFLLTIPYPAAKGFPFLSWGQLLCLYIGNLIVFCLIQLYDKSYLKLFAATVGFNGLLAFLYYAPTVGLIPFSTLKYIQLISIMITATSKIMQISKNYRNKQTGHLSLIMILLICIMNVCQLFVIFVLAADFVFLFTICSAFLGNSIILIQVIYYNKATINFRRSERSEKAAEAFIKKGPEIQIIENQKY